MLFTRKSCGPFAALVTLFLLVVQAAAVIPTPRRFQTDKNLRKSVAIPNHQVAHKIVMGTHLAAKKAHTELHAVNMDMAQRHQQYAMGLLEPHKTNHLKAAEAHQAKAKYHQVRADSHHIDALHHGNTKKVAMSDENFAQSIQKAQNSAQSAQSLKHHAKLLKSFMTTANQHRQASNAHSEAARLSSVLKYPYITGYHHLRKTEHEQNAAVHAGLALKHIEEPYTARPVAEGIKHAQAAASIARFSNYLADQTIKLSKAPAVPNSSQRQ